MNQHHRAIRRGGTAEGSGIKRVLCRIVLILGMGASAAAADFGLAVNTSGDYASDTAGAELGFRGTLTPWFSAALGEKAGFYMSGNVSFRYEHEEWETPIRAELERTELDFHPAPAVYVNLGRQQYRDSGGMILSGLFDGIHSSFSLGRARLSVGAFYTGFLYKERAEILMTAEDRDKRLIPVDYGNMETYFASRRVVVPLGLEFPDLASRVSLGLTLLAQIDVNNAPALHSQYAELRFGIDAADPLRFTLTGTGSLAESEGVEEPRAGFAAAFAMDWDMPGTLTDMLSAELRWGSGAVNERIGPFMPVSGIAQGTVFTPTLPGLMNARAGYTARIGNILSLSPEAVFFWRTDTETFKDTELDSASQDRFLGTEVYGSLVLAFRSALRMVAGGGVFFPSGVFVETAGIRWKINAGIILSL